MEENHQLITLANGIRLLHMQVKNTEIVHVGYLINTGSRDENIQNNGVAHFIEHAVFKGTEKRRSHHILRRIENVGGDLNAYTTREKTCYYASCLKQYASRAVDLLTDITFHSIFPENEIAKEKKVILEEIDMYEDSPDESIYDDFYTMIFKDHPLGYNILGTKDTVTQLKRETILDFIKGSYLADDIVLSIVGDITLKQAEALGRRWVEKIPVAKGQSKFRTTPEILPAFSQKAEKDFAQAHFIMGSRAYSRNDERRFALSLMNNILGGAGMSARLNMAVREKHGLTYSISSHYSGYQDAGVFSIYFATDVRNVNRCRELVLKELKKMREIKFSQRQLEQAKIQLLGQMAQVVENNSAQMQYQAKSILDYGKFLTFGQFMDDINKVTASDMLEAANDVFNPDNMSYLIFEPEKEEEEDKNKKKKA